MTSSSASGMRGDIHELFRAAASFSPAPALFLLGVAAAVVPAASAVAAVLGVAVLRVGEATPLAQRQRSATRSTTPTHADFTISGPWLVATVVDVVTVSERTVGVASVEACVVVLLLDSTVGAGMGDPAGEALAIAVVVAIAIHEPPIS